MRIALLSVLLAAVVTPAYGNPVQKAGQMVVVTTPQWKSVQGHMYLFDREKTGWVQHGKPIPVVVGRSGMGWGIGLMAAGEGTTKAEGDGKAPAGLFTLTRVFGAKPMATKMPFLQLEPGMTCVDDPKSSAYNRIVPASHPKDWKSGEDLSALYAFGIVVDHNVHYPQRRMGSCIFFHPWRRSTGGTLGCTGVPEAQLRAMVQWLSPEKSPLLVQMPQAIYAENQSVWGFPPLTQ